MAYLENSIFTNPTSKPSIYARYVDDIFIQINSLEQLDLLKTQFENNSVLKFTYETSIDNKILFLDTLVDASNNRFHTTVYHKPTDQGQCLNADSECSLKYKKSVIFNYLQRAYKISQNWQDFHAEINYIKQILINNNYSNTIVDDQINSFINSKVHPSHKPDTIPTKLPLFYQSQFHSNYKIEE